ncbi:COP1-interacting protein 7-like isoform X2 [Hibiscus syriacus]|uniref:COP1-interacting protein 7-like isoform X2 n=1 Tax=Hibiscus syriacus TaxID=106335 RepID=UPI0019236A1C|nr:COP1-interacting protein 7-like isoform X2 [Hibiscus syriacus]
MDSTTILDRALFQLTPTRTRFDLVLFYKGKNEKLASGLFEPFICHLKFARDQISKGGYSITLQPPAPGTPWFTKATFERFVRFVSTPAVLERFVTIETEILQIERSIQANELANANGRQEEDANGHTKKPTDLTKVKGELKIKDEIKQEENSKVQLQRLLETRKALLWKEQAMTYARGLVAGFAMENMEHLISFADAFGASRLREASINFKELCKKKHADHLWMEELAAVEACSPSELPLLGTSGIVLANGISISNDHTSNESSAGSTSDTCAGAVDSKKDDNLPASVQTPSSTTSKSQVPMQWLNQMPQHMYNFQGHLPQYQGYPFHPMQPVPLPYPMNMQWPPNFNQKSTSKLKKKFSNGKKLDYSGEERETEFSGSDSGSESGSDVQQEDRRHSSPDPPFRKKNRKKSSGTVVIRNINYITPNRRSGEKDQASDGSYSSEDDLIDADFLKQKVDDAVKSLKESGKSNSSNRKRRGADKSHHIVEKSSDASCERDSDDLDVNTSEGGKRNGNWDALQNLLMRGEENPSMNEVEWKQAEDVQEHFMARNFDGELSATTPLNLESQKAPIKRAGLVDSFVVTERVETNETRVKLDDFVNGENYRPVMKKGDSVEVDLLPPERSVESGKKLGDPVSASANESTIIRYGKEEDWFAGNDPIKSENQHSSNNQMLFNGDCVLSVESDPLYSQKSRKDVLIDDSFMVAAWPAGVDQVDSQLKTDISMVADLTSPSKPDGTKDVSQDEHKRLDAEPIDLCMVLERNPGYESSRDSWTMDYQIDLSFTETNRSAARKCDDEKVSSDHEITISKHDEVQGMKKPAKEARSRVLNGPAGRSKTEIVSKSKKPSLVSRSITQKSKLEKEEEMRKKMEELRIERQKRIAERTAAADYASSVSTKSPLESKGTKGSIKSDKNKNVSTAQATSRVNPVKLRAT